MRTILLSSLTLLLGGLCTVSAAVEPLVTKQRAFEIPFHVDNATAGLEVRLYVSTNRGGSWQLYARREPAAGKFGFQTSSDGEYWFASRTLLSSEPTFQANLQPELKIVVDTAPPVVELNASVDSSGKVNLKWTIDDFSVDIAQARLEYQTQLGGTWTSIPLDVAAANKVEGGYQGSTQFTPESAGKVINVRALARDFAGNPAAKYEHVFLPAIVPQPGNNPSNSDPIDPIAGQPGVNGGNSNGGVTNGANANGGGVQIPLANWRPSNPRDSATGGETAADATPNVAANEVNQGAVAPLDTRTFAGNPSELPIPDTKPLPLSGAPSPLGQQWRPDAADVSNYPSTNTPSAEIPLTQNVSQHNVSQRTETEVPTGDVPEWADLSRFRMATRGEDPARPKLLEPAPVDPIADLPPGVRPRMINFKRFNLQYDLETVGPSGVTRVELWFTRDGGKTWSAWGNDPDRTSPFVVEVENEGIYGFRIVVQGGNDLTSPRPQPGDLADIWVGIDVTEPTARITSAMYGSDDLVGQLEIRWYADDYRLATRPITLSYSETPAGPWTPIAAGLPNSGRYNWKVDRRIPENFHIRVEARDEAGNVSSFVTDQPISNEGLAPSARIKSLIPWDGERG